MAGTLSRASLRLRRPIVRRAACMTLAPEPRRLGTVNPWRRRGGRAIPLAVMMWAVIYAECSDGGEVPPTTAVVAQTSRRAQSDRRASLELRAQFLSSQGRVVIAVPSALGIGRLVSFRQLLADTLFSPNPAPAPSNRQ